MIDEASIPPVLQLQGLTVTFETSVGELRAVNRLDMTIKQNEIMGLVGESGSGKTVTALSIMRLLRIPPARVEGRIIFEGEDLLALDKRSMTHIRGGKIAMIYQDPLTSLNPVLRVGDQIAETIIRHQGMGKREAMQAAVDAMGAVGIASADTRAREYPHQMSGGMRQRIVIATALSCRPRLLIADEPTTMLDLLSQAQLIKLFQQLRRELGSILYITHDMGIIAQLCDRVTVMYASRIMEIASVEALFSHPLHPYTIALLESVTRTDAKLDVLKYIDGNMPDLAKAPLGCIFHPRCRFAKSECSRIIPELREVQPDHFVACLRSEEFLAR